MAVMIVITFTVFVGVMSCFWYGRQNELSSFSAHGKIGNFIIIIIVIRAYLLTSEPEDEN